MDEKKVGKVPVAPGKCRFCHIFLLKRALCQRFFLPLTDIMDFTSIEFYTIAFCVAMAIVGFFLRQKRIKPATSRINSMELAKQESAGGNEATSQCLLKLVANDDGTVTIERTGLQLVDGETVNLIATIIDDKLTIEEKKGKVSGLGGREEAYTGRVTLDFIPSGSKMYVRYDSSVTGQWCKFAFKNFPRNIATHELRY